MQSLIDPTPPLYEQIFLLRLPYHGKYIHVYCAVVGLLPTGH